MPHPDTGARSLPAVAQPPPASALLAGLTPEQAQAVQHGPGPLLLIAGPGAGKTKTLIHRVAHLLASGRARPHEILAVTFSVRAAGELRLRLCDLLGEQQARGVTAATFHSVCARILREHAEAFGRTESYTVYDPSDVRRVIDWVLSDAARAHIQQALQHTGQPASGEVLAEISLAKSRLLTPDGYETSARHAASRLIAAVWRELERELRRSNAFDFDDLLAFAVTLLAEQPHRLAFYRQRWPWILVDEFQDTNEAQAVLAALLAGPGGNVCCVGDDDQCVPRGTAIQMADGSTRPVERLRPGQLVRSNHGRGEFAPARVLRVRQRSCPEGVRISLASGRSITSTPEHIHFAGFSAGESAHLYFTYVMWRRDRGWRVGFATGAYRIGRDDIRFGPAHRGLIERADAVWVISSHDTEVKARLAEVMLAARYGLPTVSFVAVGNRPGGLVSSQEHLDAVFRGLESDERGRRLLAAEGLSFDLPHYQPKARTTLARHGEARYVVNVTLCADRAPLPMHRIAIQGSDEAGRERLQALGVPLREAREDGGWRYDTTRRNYDEVLGIADMICSELGAVLRQVASLGKPAAPKSHGATLPHVPAALVREGMVMVNDEGHLDRVTGVRGVQLDGPVFDLDVERTHNYVADGIVTHNCIYSWRGAEHDNMLAFGERFPGHETIVLGRNFRCRAEILEPAVACVAHNRARSAKALIAMRGPGGSVGAHGFASEHAEGEWVAGLIADALSAGTAPSEVLVLARTGFASGPVQHALARAGIAHRVLGALGLYERAEVRDALAYLTLLANPADAQAFRRAIAAPRRGVGPATANRIVAHARTAHDGDIITCCAHAGTLPGIRGQTADLVARFGDQLERIRRELAHRSLGHAVVQTVTLDGGLVAPPRAAPRPLAECRGAPRRRTRPGGPALAVPSRAGLRAPAPRPRGADRLTRTRRRPARPRARPGEPDRRITISTIHRSKGTEAQLVVLCGCEEQLLPSWRALADPDPAALEEERRLFYVAATRAKDRLVITHAATRHGRPTGGPSRFLSRSGPDPRRAAARRLNRPKGTVMPNLSPATATRALDPPARTQTAASVLLRRPFAPGAIGFRAMTKVALNGNPYGGAQVAAFLNAQSITQRLNAVCPGAWRMDFAPVPSELVPTGSREDLPRLPADDHSPARPGRRAGRRRLRRHRGDGLGLLCRPEGPLQRRAQARRRRRRDRRVPVHRAGPRRTRARRRPAPGPGDPARPEQVGPADHQPGDRAVAARGLPAAHEHRRGASRPRRDPPPRRTRDRHGPRRGRRDDHRRRDPRAADERARPHPAPAAAASGEAGELVPVDFTRLGPNGSPAA